MVPPEALQAAWESEVAANGPVTAAGPPVSEPAGPGGVVVKIPVSFERGAATVAVRLAGEENWVTGIQLLPAGAAEPAEPWAPPPYADPRAVHRDLSRWQAALESRPDVTISVYEADNHLFFPGSGPSAPAEYEPAQHVDPAVVSDIASWLTQPRAPVAGQ